MNNERITLATLPAATAQQVFDQVARHLLTQGRQARNAEACAYRGSEGTMCAAGCLMSDEEYAKLTDTSVDGRATLGIEGLNWEALQRGGVVPPGHTDLIQSLQAVHDDVDTDEWSEELHELAANCRLSPAVLEEFL
jgi:hypothetical protein